MKLIEVSNVDGRMCAQLLNLLKYGKWELSGNDIAAHSETIRWVNGLASQMAEQLKQGKSTSTASESQSIKVKSMGQLPPSAPKLSSNKSPKKSRKK